MSTKLIYAVMVKKTAPGMTFVNDRLDDEILAYANRAAFDLHQDKLWEGSKWDGMNLITISFEQVQSALRSLKVQYSAGRFPGSYIVRAYDNADIREHNDEYYKSLGQAPCVYLTAGDIAAIAANA